MLENTPPLDVPNVKRGKDSKQKEIIKINFFRICLLNNKMFLSIDLVLEIL